MRHGASGCLSRTGLCTHLDGVLQHIHLHEYGLADALSDVGREHGLVMGLDPVSSTRVPPRTPGGCQLVHCPQLMDAKYQDSRIVYASICQTVPEMHAAHALRQPKRPFQLDCHVAIPQVHVEEQTYTLQASASFPFSRLSLWDAAIDFNLFFVSNVLKKFQRREFFRTELNNKLGRLFGNEPLLHNRSVDKMLRGALQRSRGTQLSTESKKRVVGRIAVVGVPCIIVL